MPISGNRTAPRFIMARTTLCALAAAYLFTAAPLLADDKGQEQIQKTLQAYQDTKQYESHVVITVLQDSGRIKSTATADYNFTFDRDVVKLLNDRTDFFMVIDQGKLSIKSDQIPASFVRIDAPTPLTYEELLKQASFINNIAQPDLLYLTSIMPTLHLGGRIIENKTWDSLPPRADDPAKRPGIKAPIGSEELTFWIDPATQLITQVVRGPGPNVKDPTKTFTTYDIQIKIHNKDLPKDAFKFDANGLIEKPTVEAWLAAPAANPAAPPAAEAAPGADAPAPQAVPVPGKAAAPAREPKSIDPKNITLKTLDDKDVKLTDLNAKVVVLTFWESWAKSCHEAMPKMQLVSDWMTESKTPGIYYAVNIREDVKDVKTFLTQNKLTLPVLLDPEGKAGEFFVVNNLPKTVILINGKVFKAFNGLSPNMDREIKSAILDGLKRAQREEKNPSAPADPTEAPKTTPLDDSKI